MKRKNTDESEMGLIGSLLLSPKKVLEACNDRGLTSLSFSAGKNQAIYAAIEDMVKLGKKIDLITVTEYMDSTDRLPSAGGAAGITESISYVPTAANYETYLDIVLKNSAIRSAKIEWEKINKELSCAIDSDDVRKILSSAFSEPMNLIRPATSDDTDRSLLLAYVNSVEDRAKGTTQTVFSTPLETLNRKTGGTGAGEVLGILGVPSAGKSILGKQFALHNLLQHGMPTMVITGEMPYQQWIDRAVCEIGRIDFRNFRMGRLTDQEQKTLAGVIGRIAKLPLYVYDRKRLRMERGPVEAAIRSEARSHGIKCVLLDYLQLIKSPSKKELRTDQEIGEVSNMLKDVSVNFGLHTIALCAENDDGQVRNSREPEYDFDNILKMIVRTDKNPNTGNPMIITDKILVTKWRDSERGYAIRVEMEGKHCRFNDVTGPNI